MSMTSQETKVAVIGWDAATWDVLFPLLKSGKLPNLSKLMASGKWGTLKSTIQPISPTAWASIITGQNPGKHGIFDFISIDSSYRPKPTNGGMLQSTPIWSHLSRAGKQVLVVNVPMTYPPRAINGVMISGMDAPYLDRLFTYPSYLSKILHHKFNFTVEVTRKKRKIESKADFLRAYSTYLVTTTEEQSKVVQYLLRLQSFDFIFLVFTTPDRMQHIHGTKIMSPLNTSIQDVYESCDQALGVVMQELGQEWNYILLSDHGAAPYKKVFELSTWLEQDGYLNIVRTQRRSAQRLSSKFLYKLRRQTYKYLGLSQERIADKQGFMGNVDWDATKAFSVGAFGNIYLNTRSRFSNGILSEREYKDMRHTLMEKLLAIRDPETGARVVKEVYFREDVYQGSFLHLAPDILIETTGDYFVRNNLDHIEGKIFYPAGLYGNRLLPHTGKHTADGVLVISGPMFVQDNEPGDANVFDITPTLLYLFGLPIPTDIDGRLLMEWLSPDYVRRAKITYTDQSVFVVGKNAYTTTEQSLIEKRLKDLGYL